MATKTTASTFGKIKDGYYFSVDWPSDKIYVKIPKEDGDIFNAMEIHTAERVILDDHVKVRDYNACAKISVKQAIKMGVFEAIGKSRGVDLKRLYDHDVLFDTDALFVSDKEIDELELENYLFI